MHIKSIPSNILITLYLMLLTGSMMTGCAAEDREPPDRAFFEKHFLDGLPLKSNEHAFRAQFRSAACKDG